MVWTTPQSKKDEHKSWHVFVRGLCLYCGWHCDDCPIGVATCKCTGPATEVADRRLLEENRKITSDWMD